jgi:hypothetical protein
MLPAMTFARRPALSRYRRQLLAAAGIILAGIVAVEAMVNAPSQSGTAGEAPRSLAERLSVSTWAITVPAAWLATPLSGQVGDSVDLLAVRTGEHPVAIALAADLRVMSIDERAVVFEVDEESATAVATARASGLLLVPLLRSTR